MPEKPQNVSQIGQSTDDPKWVLELALKTQGTPVPDCRTRPTTEVLLGQADTSQEPSDGLVRTLGCGRGEGSGEDLPGLGVTPGSDGELAENLQAPGLLAPPFGLPQEFEATIRVKGGLFIAAETLCQPRALNIKFSHPCGAGRFRERIVQGP